MACAPARLATKQRGGEISVVSMRVCVCVCRGAMKSFKGGMQDRNLGPLLPDVFFSSFNV